MRHPCRAAVFLALLIAAISVRADTLETDDGKTIEGKIVDQNAASVTIEVRSEGMTFRRKFPAARIKHITREAAEGPA